MRKLSLFLVTMILASSFVFAHGDDEDHSKVRRLISSEFNITEINEKTMTGAFKDMSVWLEKFEEKKKVFYKGWVMKDGKKLPLSIFYKDKKLHGDFNGNKFAYLSMDKKNQSYTFKTDKDKTAVSYLYETKKGRHMINPLFVAKNNKRNYMVRLKGESCMGHALYYSAVIYGLTTLDEVEERVEDKSKGKNKEEAENHKH